MDKSELTRIAFEISQSARIATLCTNSLKHAGYPFGSWVDFALDNQGQPILLLSQMAVHTKNLLEDNRSSLMLATPSTQPTSSLARMTAIGNLNAADDLDQELLKQQFVARNPQASQWVTFGDFRIFQMELLSIYVVGGFGLMGWVSPDDYFSQFA